MKLTNKFLNDVSLFTEKIIRQSSCITLNYFSPKVKFRIKDNMTPVTIADIKCEDFIINSILKEFPSHNIHSEESGKYMQNSEFTWIIDPVDGTKNFMRGYPFWGTLIALEYKKEIILGYIYMPVLKELIYAVKNNGCYRNNKKIRVSKTSVLRESYILYGGLENFSNYQKNFVNMLNDCYYSRGFGDCHGHTFIMYGNAEAMIDPRVAPYDVAPIKICIEEAGGKFTDFKGEPTIYNGTAITSNSQIHQEIIKKLNK